MQKAMGCNGRFHPSLPSFLPNPQKEVADSKKKRRQEMHEAGNHRERDLSILTPQAGASGG